MVGSYQLMLGFFVDCNQIREFCNRLQAETEKMQEVSMNAAIAAGHTGSHIRTFTEIARQIGLSSARLSNRIQKVRGDTNQVVNETLDAMIRATRLSYFERALPGVKGEANARLVRSRMEATEAEIQACLAGIFRDVQVILSDLHAIEDLQKRFWAVITRLRIEASTMDPDEQVFVASISESLEASIERSTASFDQLFETVRRFESKLVA